MTYYDFIYIILLYNCNFTICYIVTFYCYIMKLYKIFVIDLIIPVLECPYLIYLKDKL